MAKLESILDAIGRTPVVKIRRLAPPHVTLWVKVEAQNPLGSVKDRLAVGIIDDAERRGLLAPGQTVLEATSGNTGIGLAMVCAARGYPLVILMSESFSVERRKLMRYLGAKVVLTPAWARGAGMMAKAFELARAHGWFFCRQFDNEANADIHSTTTAREILADFEGERLDYWVTGAGTGGTLKGVGRVLRELRPQTKIVLCEPDNSPTLSSGIPQPREPDGSITLSHPLARPHPVQGWAPDFIAKLTEDALADGLVDRIVPVDSGESMRLSRELARKEGIFTGTSGGATFAAALAVCRDAPPGSTVLCMLPDTGERYQSTPLFDGILAGMNDAELEISRSTPSARFDGAPPPAPAVPAGGAIDPEVEAYVESILGDRAQPVVLFAFAWCEFCWSVRKLFGRLGVDYRSVDLDSPALQKDDRGGKIRAAVSARSRSPSIPQIFVGGRFLGGATETLAAFQDGSLVARFREHGVGFDESVRLDAMALLPAWLQPR